MQAFESVSTWRQQVPRPASAERTALIATVASWAAALGPSRLRVAVDGLTGAGKTSFGHELAAALRGLGRATMRASIDDFKHPWRHARGRQFGSAILCHTLGRHPVHTAGSYHRRRRRASDALTVPATRRGPRSGR